VCGNGMRVHPRALLASRSERRALNPREAAVHKEVNRIMRKYELMFILQPDLEQDAVNAQVEKFAGIIQNGGEIVKQEVLGKRRLAYEIQKQREGIYVLYVFHATPDVVKELDRVLRITDEVIRHLIVKDVA
jgi:small subunit ribosomal protein S6